jgi:subtilase family serine protease
MAFFRLPLPYLLSFALLFSVASAAQQALPRITEQVSDASLTTLKGNVPASARSQYDQGAADASTQITGVRLVFSRTDAQKTALDKYLVELQNASSANYHKWLTPAQFGALYGPADSDIAALTAWLQSHGLTVDAVESGRTGISFSGSASQLEEAFHTSIHSYKANGRQFYSNSTEPQIPSALAGVVAGVAHMNTIKPKPLSVRGQAGKLNNDSKRVESLSVSAKPNLTETSSGTYYLYVVPGDAATIYNTPNSTFNVNYSSGTSYTGSGVTIGVGGAATIDTSIVQAYREYFLGNTTAPTVTTVTSQQESADADEAYIDTELAGAMAPAATIHYYMDDNYLGIQQMLNDNTVDIFSLSFGDCEQDMGTSGNSQMNSWWQQAAAQGITVVVSSGDSGSAGCDATSDSSGNNVTTASSGLAVSGYASTPYNIAVGGTDYYNLESNYSTYASTSEGSSSTYYRTAKSYIRESTWNDSTINNTTLSENEPWSAKGSSYSSDNNIVAGSGGKSSCASTSSGSCAGYSKPSWQTGTGVPTDSVRDIPDVSLLAGNGYDDAVWAVCDNETSQGVTTNCTSGYVDGYGGTSTSAPAFAGIMALIVQKTGSRQGQAAKELYTLFNTYGSTIFHDITVGNISVPCKSGSTNCSKNSAGYYFESGYDTTTGYDLATGLGSVDATKLLTYWSSTSTGTTSSTVTVSPGETSIDAGQSLSVTVAISPSGSTAPTGSVTLASGSYSATETIGTSPCTSYSACVFTISGGSLATGTDTLTATYGGDSTYASESGTASVTVTASTYSVALSSSSASVSPGGSATSTITLSSSSGYTGTVKLTCTITASQTSSNTPTCSISPASLTMSNGTASGTATLTISTTSTSASLARPALPASKRNWPGSGIAAGSSAALAVLFFFLVPARRRNWRNLLGALLLIAVLGGLSACGSGTSSSSGSKTSSGGTTAGTYTITVTGTGSDASTTTETATFTLTVS